MLPSTAYADSRLSLWQRVRAYAVPPSMIELATGRRAAGDWAGACAAARIDVDLDLRSVARAHGRELTARLRADLRHLAPDLLRWHMPRIAPDGLLRPGLTLTLARYGGAGRAGPLRLVARTPPAWADAGQRISLALWDPAGARTGGHPHPHPSRRYRLDLHRHLWDARRAAELRDRSGAGGPTPPDADPQGLAPPGHGCAVGRWAAEAGILLAAEGAAPRLVDGGLPTAFPARAMGGPAGVAGLRKRRRRAGAAVGTGARRRARAERAGAGRGPVPGGPGHRGSTGQCAGGPAALGRGGLPSTAALAPVAGLGAPLGRLRIRRGRGLPLRPSGAPLGRAAAGGAAEPAAQSAAGLRGRRHVGFGQRRRTGQRAGRSDRRLPGSGRAAGPGLRAVLRCRGPDRAAAVPDGGYRAGGRRRDRSAHRVRPGPADAAGRGGGPDRRPDAVARGAAVLPDGGGALRAGREVVRRERCRSPADRHHPRGRGW